MTAGQEKAIRGNQGGTRAASEPKEKPAGDASPTSSSDSSAIDDDDVRDVHTGDWRNSTRLDHVAQLLRGRANPDDESLRNASHHRGHAPAQPNDYADLLEERISLYLEDLLRADNGVTDPGIPSFAPQGSTEIVHEGEVISFGDAGAAASSSSHPASPPGEAQRGRMQPLRAPARRRSSSLSRGGVPVRRARTGSLTLPKPSLRKDSSLDPAMSQLRVGVAAASGHAPTLTPIRSARLLEEQAERGEKGEVTLGDDHTRVGGFVTSPQAFGGRADAKDDEELAADAVHSAPVGERKRNDVPTRSPPIRRASSASELPIERISVDSPPAAPRPALAHSGPTASTRPRAPQLVDLLARDFPSEHSGSRTSRASSSRTSSFSSDSGGDVVRRGHRVSFAQLPPSSEQRFEKAKQAGAAMARGYQPGGLLFPTLISFRPGDASHPRHWGPVRKWYATLAILFACCMANAGFNLVAPAWAETVVALGARTTNDARVDAFLGVWALGLCLAPLFAVPLSETFGRRRVVLVSLSACALFNELCAASHSLDFTIVLRFLSSVSAGVPLGLAGCVVGDLWAPEERIVPMYLLGVVSHVGPCLGPVMAGFLMTWVDQWPWVFHSYTITLGVAIVLYTFTSETYIPCILERQAKKARKETGNDQMRSIFEHGREPLRKKLARSAGMPFAMFFTEPIIAVLGIYLALIFAVSNILATNLPTLMFLNYQWSPAKASLMYLPIVVGGILGGAFALIYIHTKRESKDIETLLAPAPMSALTLCFALPIYGFLAHASRPWPILAACLLVISCAVCCAATLVQAYEGHAYGHRAAEALASGIVLRCLLTFGGQFVSYRHNYRLGAGWVYLFWSAAILLATPLLLLVWGAGWRLRARSRRAVRAAATAAS